VSPQWSFSLRFPHQNPVHTSSLPSPSYMTRSSHSSRFYHPYNSGLGVEITKLLIMEYFPLPCYLDQSTLWDMNMIYKPRNKVYVKSAQTLLFTLRSEEREKGRLTDVMGEENTYF
jgi:hypothetical protein